MNEGAPEREGSFDLLLMQPVDKVLASHPWSRDCDDELDDVTSILADLCDELHEQELAFLVRGFGRRIQVDVATDLCVVLEQLPGVVDALRNRDQQFVLSFFEQGVEVDVIAERSEESLSLRLAKLSSTASVDGWEEWRERIPVPRFTKMVERLTRQFVHLAETCAPGAMEHPWMQEWVSSILHSTDDGDSIDERI